MHRLTLHVILQSTIDNDILRTQGVNLSKLLGVWSCGSKAHNRQYGTESHPPAVGVRGMSSGKIFEILKAKSCISDCAAATARTTA